MTTKPSNPKDAIATFKLPLHLCSPLAKAYWSMAQYLGMVKYGAWNWREAGARASVYKSALERHMDAWWEGEFYDSDGTPHLANAMACIAILVECQYRGTLVDDRPPSFGTGYRQVLEADMQKIFSQYGHRQPKHWTITDTELANENISSRSRVPGVHRSVGDRKGRKGRQSGLVTRGTGLRKGNH